MSDSIKAYYEQRAEERRAKEAKEREGAGAAIIVTITYKSGSTKVVRVSSFKFNGHKWTWNALPNEKYPDIIMVLNPEDIESVFYRYDGNLNTEGTNVYTFYEE